MGDCDPSRYVGAHCTAVPSADLNRARRSAPCLGSRAASSQPAAWSSSRRTAAVVGSGSGSEEIEFQLCEQLSHHSGRNIGHHKSFSKIHGSGETMSKIFSFVAVAGIVSLSATFSVAAPCNVGTTTNMSGMSNDTSSNVDGGTDGKVTPGAKAESSGTVGAMNNVGVSTKDDGLKKAHERKPIKPGSIDC
jgi:hypothetical protein